MIDRMNNRTVKSVLAGILLFGALALVALVERPSTAVLTAAFLAWCVGAFIFGMLYRDFIREVRQRKARGTRKQPDPR
jgi:ABC-type transport system involved in cytochrome c biogenesis permease subunit